MCSGRHMQFLLRLTAALSILFFVYYLYNLGPNGISKIIKASGRRAARAIPPPECACRKEEGNSDIYDFCFSVNVNGVVKRGQRFDCKWLVTLEQLGILDPSTIEEGKISDPVFATASSSNHFGEAKALIASIRARFGNKPRIVLYDLGLNPTEVDEVKAACNVDYRKFNFNIYPASFRDLRSFRWKTILIAQLQNEFPAYWWVDSSIRWTKSDLSEVYDAVSAGKLGSYLTVDKTFHGVLAATNPNMLKYLPFNEEKGGATMMYGGGFVFIRRSPASVEAIKWLVLCAMEDNCINPPGSRMGCNFAHRENYAIYAECHRYDQSAINVILGGLNDYKDSFYSTKNLKPFAEVKRGTTNSAKLTGCGEK